MVAAVCHGPVVFAVRQRLAAHESSLPHACPIHMAWLRRNS